MANRWRYSGDVNLEQGGVFYNLAGWSNGYADAVRVTPCSDGGGQDNAFWVEALTVIIPESELDRRWGDVLRSCGWVELPGDTLAQRKSAFVEAAVGYGLYDPANCYPESQSEVVQIGVVADHCGLRSEVVKPTVILRGNASLRRFVDRFIVERF